MKRSAANPFLEHTPTPFSAMLRVINAPVYAESNRRWLLRLTQHAFVDYGETAVTDPLRVRLIANNDRLDPVVDQPPPVYTTSDGDLLLASMTPVDIGVCSFKSGRAMITVSPAMAQFTYHIRYELIEFILYQMVRQALGAVGLHAGCVARKGVSCLLFGESGAGKSTLAYACLMRGWQFLGEDGVFMLNDTVHGTPNFIHLMEDAPVFFPTVNSMPGVGWITRRSGRRKLEIDVRRIFPSAPLDVAALGHLIFLVRQRHPRRQRPSIHPLTSADVRKQLFAQQPFASMQPQWPELLARLLARPAFLLNTGSDPHAAAALLESVI